MHSRLGNKGNEFVAAAWGAGDADVLATAKFGANLRRAKQGVGVELTICVAIGLASAFAAVCLGLLVPASAAMFVVGEAVASMLALRIVSREFARLRTVAVAAASPVPATRPVHPQRGAA